MDPRTPTIDCATYHRRSVEMEADLGEISGCSELLFGLLVEMGAVKDIREEERRGLR